MEDFVEYITPDAVAVPPGLSITDHRTGRQYQLDISETGTFNAQLLKQIKAGGDGVGLRVYDPGYTSTAAATSSISYINATEGVLTYRGYPIEELAGQCGFLEAAYLVIYGDLPSSSELAAFQESVMRHAAVPIAVQEVITALPHNTQPMACIMAGLAALGACYPEQNPALVGMTVYKSGEVQDLQISRILGKVSTLAALAFHKHYGHQFTPPNARLGFVENFLYMLFANGDASYRPDLRLVNAVEALFVLHAEHEMSCSTAAVHHLASSGVDVYTAMLAGVGALHGTLHGGASEAVGTMLQRIGTPNKVPEFLQHVKAQQQTLFGFGDGVYNEFDPRCQIIKQLALDVAAGAGDDDLAQVALTLEAAVLSDKYFTSRKLYPNVHFYSSLVYRAMGLPAAFNPVMLTVARFAGWCAHWKECIADPDTKIARPQQDYRGPWLRHYQPMAVRSRLPPTQRLHNVMSNVAGSADLSARSASSYYSSLASRFQNASTDGAADANGNEQCNGVRDGPVHPPLRNEYMRRILGDNWH